MWRMWQALKGSLSGKGFDKSRRHNSCVVYMVRITIMICSSSTGCCPTCEHFWDKRAFQLNDPPEWAVSSRRQASLLAMKNRLDPDWHCPSHNNNNATRPHQPVPVSPRGPSLRTTISQTRGILPPRHILTQTAPPTTTWAIWARPESKEMPTSDQSWLSENNSVTWTFKYLRPREREKTSQSYIVHCRQFFTRPSSRERERCVEQ